MEHVKIRWVDFLKTIVVIIVTIFLINLLIRLLPSTNYVIPEIQKQEISKLADRHSQISSLRNCGFRKDVIKYLIGKNIGNYFNWVNTNNYKNTKETDKLFKHLVDKKIKSTKCNVTFEKFKYLLKE